MSSNPRYHQGFIWRALAISLLVHGLILLQPGMGNQGASGVQPTSLVAMLRPQLSSPAVMNNPAHPAVAHPPRSQPVPNKFPGASLDAGVRAATQVASDSVAGNPTGVAVASTARPMMQNAGELEFSEGKKSYLFAIAAEARRVRKYPPRAFAAGWQGTAEIQINVAIGGVVQPPRLHRSSGYADIDEAALAFVDIAQQRTVVPESLRNRAFDVVVPVSFTINNR